MQSKLALRRRNTSDVAGNSSQVNIEFNQIPESSDMKPMTLGLFKKDEFKAGLKNKNVPDRDESPEYWKIDIDNTKALDNAQSLNDSFTVGFAQSQLQVSKAINIASVVDSGQSILDKIFS